uniref:Uncharacterized protein n=1 Tax=Rhizophora mucronata TaxID=61149 RepID=A0A2P2Q234_RHIMU
MTMSILSYFTSVHRNFSVHLGSCKQAVAVMFFVKC